VTAFPSDSLGEDDDAAPASVGLDFFTFSFVFCIVSQSSSSIPANNTLGDETVDFVPLEPTDLGVVVIVEASSKSTFERGEEEEDPYLWKFPILLDPSMIPVPSRPLINDDDDDDDDAPFDDEAWLLLLVE
jgi:hypothetical protein